MRVMLASVGLVSLAIAGCGGKNIPDVAPVNGTVRVDGRPQSGVLVRFLPDPEKGNNSSFEAFGVTDQQGKYTLRYSFAGKEGEGAAVGWNRVVCNDSTVTLPVPGQPSRKPAFPYTYADPTTSPFQFEVKPEGSSIDLEIKK